MSLGGALARDGPTMGAANKIKRRDSTDVHAIYELVSLGMHNLVYELLIIITYRCMYVLLILVVLLAIRS